MNSDVVVIGGGPGRLDRLDADRSARSQGHALRARAVSPLSHRRIAHPRDLLGPRAAQHAAEDAEEPLREEIQRPVRQRRRQAVGAVLFLGQQAPRMLTDVAGRPQRVRQDDARQRARARRRCPRGCARGRRPDRRERNGRGVGRDHSTRGRRSRGRARQGRRGRQRPERAADEPLQSPTLGSGPEQRGDLDVLEGRLPRHRPRRRRDHRHSDRQQARLVLVHSAARRPRERRRGRALRLPVQGPRRAGTDLPGRSRALPVGQGTDREGDARRPATSRPRTTRIARNRSRATAGSSSATPSVFSIRSTHPACCWR